MYNLSGKVALVTGSSRGIGEAIARKLSILGASIIINYSKDEDGANRIIEEIKENGGYAISVKADVSKYEEAKYLVEEAVNHFGKLDVVVNNAGISSLGLFMDQDVNQIENIIQVNLMGTVNVTHCAIKHLLASRGAGIVNVSSIWGNVGASYEVLYSLTKGGINTFTKALAKELAPSNIRVNAVAPGVINTEMNNFLSDDEKDVLTEEIPMGRFGEVEEIANVVSFLASDEASYVTGQVLTIDGGML
ncbi:3-oxoacyl-[acyl-carrier protein] reductase [Clostridium cavendishii DSM 21758]|uniref:3-oxoacyl-[acyl-carrier protein] reductase n=1 Tax=Clostridium cavendishii DSM 21758 TaxID=1121302 RepID=A0A1M6A8U7_9CLOT|nr:SDR family oxidoreductase [Clostridium cavendishii]SHI32880.1 3-oxoacyl-[acyl-carrier protein] reductase [Clostridium cavendishii DSM 21758]